MNEHESSTRRPKRPGSVFRLGLVFMLMGTLSGLETFFEFFNNPVPSINFLMAFVFFGIGLMRGYEPARVFAVYCGMFVAIFYTLAIVFHLNMQRDLSLLNDIIFWTISSIAITSSIWSIILLNTEKVISYFRWQRDNIDLDL